MFTGSRCPRAIASGAPLIFRRGAADRGEHRQATGAVAEAVVLRGRLSGGINLARRPHGGIGQQFRYPPDPPPASSEYSPQLTQRSRQRLAAYEMNHELLRDYWTSLLLHARRQH